MNELANVGCDGEGLRELALFAGAGGGILGGHLLGWRTVCAVEWEPYAACVLAARQNDGILPAFPVWDDVQTFDGRPWRGIVDVVSGGFPCQDISAAGKGAGIDGERSGMWSHMARIVGEVRPKYVFVENSPILTSRGLHRVLGDLAALGFNAKWGVVSASDVGAPHQRDRIWIVANSTSFVGNELGAKSEGQQREAGVADGGHEVEDSTDRGCEVFKNSTGPSDQSDSSGHEMANANIAGCEAQRLRTIRPGEGGQAVVCGSEVADSSGAQREGNQCSERIFKERPVFNGSDTYESQGRVGGVSWWQTEPDVGRVANGVAARMDRLKATGNGQVSLVAATAWSLLK